MLGNPTTALRRVPAAPSIGGLRPPTSPADLTYPSIKRYTHGNSKEMKGRHPAYSKFCGSCSYYFFSVSIGITYGRRSHVLFKYYVSKSGGDGGSRLVLIMLTQGWVQNLGYLADVTLEPSKIQMITQFLVIEWQSRNWRNGAVSGSRNFKTTAISGSRNHENGPKYFWIQIL